jgi:hypothetical protein
MKQNLNQQKATPHRLAIYAVWYMLSSVGAEGPVFLKENVNSGM